MRRLSARQRRWLVYHAKHSNELRLSSLARARARRRGEEPARAFFKGPVNRISAPTILSFTENYDEVSRFFDQLPGLIMRRLGTAYVDLSTIERAGPRAALALAAILDMWQRLKGIKLVARDAARWHPNVRRLFVELGLFDLLRTRKPPRLERFAPPGAVRTLKFCSGEGSDGSLAKRLTTSMVDMAGPIEAERFLYVGLTEAMTNVAQHAYRDASYEGVPHDYQRWWMTGSYDTSGRCMRVIIFDLGVGIPATLPRSGHWEQIRGLLARIGSGDDANMIAAAVEAGRSSSGMSSRGHGLDEIRQFVENSNSGRLRILSGGGEVIYTNGSPIPEKRNLANSLAGTLIEWEVYR